MSENLDFSGAKPEDFKLVGSEEPAAEPVQQENVEPAQEVAPVESAEPVQETTVQQTVEPEVKQEAAPDYQFKDDFIKGLVEYYEKTGDVTPYLQAKTVDFQKLSDEEIMRRNLREQYPDISDKAFDRLYKTQVVDKYKIDADEWGEEDSELGRELLKAEASKLRNSYAEWQKNFTAPEPVASNDEQESIELLQKFEQEVKSHQATKSLLDGKKITIKTQDGEFNYELPEANRVLDMTINNDLFFTQFANDNGQLDYDRWYKTAAYSQNPELFERALINFGKTLGRTEVTKEIKNPQITPANDVPTDSSGDFTSGLLQAFANRGIVK
jgi:hypothetical protein